jgi:hypothetical protein
MVAKSESFTRLEGDGNIIHGYCKPVRVPTRFWLFALTNFQNRE